MEPSDSHSTPIKSILKRPLFFVGLMGCGKTAIGSRAAKRWGLKFYDMDKVIESEENMTVSQLFETKGEAYFRNKEVELTKRLVTMPPCIIATGGGAFMNETIRDLIQNNAISVWLNADYDTLLERVSRKKTRPLLEQGNKANILRTLMDQRTPYYRMAHVTINSNNQPHQKMINHLKNQIIQYISVTQE